jgi:3-deoxy-manno-octulosonate cytidylyltransferase (CMP-KDO synthetase)
MKITGIIPSRFGSKRFPGKPLANIHGKTMIRRVYEQASKSKTLNDVIVATDDERIFNEVKNFGGKAMMTSAKHQSGTDRCAEVAATIDTDYIVNIQGDEPFIEPEQIDLLAGLFTGDVQITTLIRLETRSEELQNPSRVKVVVNNRMEALYFSRSVIPFLRDKQSFTVKYYSHVGIYGYRKEALMQLVKLSPSALELAESLEQLRWLENGYCIQCSVTPYNSISIDTPEDLERVNTLRQN